MIEKKTHPLFVLLILAFLSITIYSQTCNVLNCETCALNDPSFCETCITGYAGGGTSCNPICGAQCSSCNEPGGCNGCHSGYTLLNSACSPECSVSGCASCSSPNVCSVCSGNNILS